MIKVFWKSADEYFVIKNKDRNITKLNKKGKTWQFFRFRIFIIFVGLKCKEQYFATNNRTLHKKDNGIFGLC